MPDDIQGGQIIFNESLQKYELHLPNSILQVVLLDFPHQQSFNIVHKEKLQLEWLQSDILIQYKESLKADAERRKFDRIRIGAYGLLIVVLVFSTSWHQKLADLIYVPLFVTKLAVVLIGMFLIWKIFKSLLFGGFSPNDTMESLKVIQLRKRIEENYS